MARAGRNGGDEDLALTDSIAMIGFGEAPSLEAAADYEVLRDIVRTAHPDAPTGRVRNFVSQLWTFRGMMKQGEFFVLPRKQMAQVTVGFVGGLYEHRQVNGTPRHTRPVRWDRVAASIESGMSGGT